MSSFVYYKFKSQKDESRVAFDGTGISVADLKREIIQAKELGKATDFDLLILDPATDEEYDDSHIVPRSASVVAKRVPPSRPGKGKAAMYVTKVGRPESNGTPPLPPKERPNLLGQNTWSRNPGPSTKRYDSKDTGQEAQDSKSSTPVPSLATADEEDALAAMFAAEQENWSATQEKMSQAQRVYSAPRGRKPFPGQGEGRSSDRYQPYHPPSDRPIPAGYVCYRCGQKGHWIQDCPTNNNKEWDHKPRLKRTTGIPRSFLKTVEQPTDSQLAQGVMITPEGSYVVAQPDSAAWEKQKAKPKTLTEADVRERPVTDPNLACPLCSKLFHDAVKTPCCSTTYGEGCIQTHLLERDFICPKCSTRIASLDLLVEDKPMRTRIMDHIDALIEQSHRSEAENSRGDGGEDQPRTSTPRQPTPEEQEYSEEQPGGPLEAFPQSNQPGYQEGMSLEQLQAEIQQLQAMLSNHNLPLHIRNQTQMQLQQKQVMFAQAQTMAALLTQVQAQAQIPQQSMFGMPDPFGGVMGMPQQQMYPAFNNYGQNGAYKQPNWADHQNMGPESPYQRLPVNPRRRHLKRDRPSDFLEVGGQSMENKFPRYWE
ncbi:DWNN-domain-containing protein [Sistotremastrum niveocremeum HHB9708]|uniref:DWNN-domain-containing protein n=2 Tax=Sistotremastraceae TaxID=3402574 RepID=A0A164VN97_9AGAM|nr:DWNN-domain-containing protein [Sistotremastrum niveocremeum HHB9708]KZT39385.1 DWNN-domain-containing protein [Sistotremastrum suecicum HHB10207 ss-3]